MRTTYQLARRFGVQAETIEGWRTEALEAELEREAGGAPKAERANPFRP